MEVDRKQTWGKQIIVSNLHWSGQCYVTTNDKEVRSASLELAVGQRRVAAHVSVLACSSLTFLHATRSQSLTNIKVPAL